MLTKQAQMFTVLFIIFFLATGNFFGTLAGCVVNAVLYQWSQGVLKNEQKS